MSNPAPPPFPPPLPANLPPPPIPPPFPTPGDGGATAGGVPSSGVHRGTVRGGAGVGVGGSRVAVPFTNTVLITNLPQSFHGYHQLRELLSPCGTAKSCVFYPRVPKRNRKHQQQSGSNDDRAKNYQDDGSDPTDDHRSTPGACDNDDASNEHSSSKLENKKITVLVNMINPDQALKLVACFKCFVSKLESQYGDMRCFMVPSSPEVPLPPPLVDDTTQQVLGDKLCQNFAKAVETMQPQRNGTENDTKIEDENMATTGSTQPEKSDKTSAIDPEKAAAAAGGTYDADEDPLNAPNVLSAVKEFRLKLDKMQANQKTKRAELVAKKLMEARPRIRNIVEDEKKQKRQQPNTVRQHQQQGPPQALLPQPSLPPGGNLPKPPLPVGLPTPPQAVNDSGKRGRSNLPAWMTQQQQQQHQSTVEPDAKRLKTKDIQPTNFPTNLPQASHDLLRQFITDKVRESMDVEERTLIDFIHSHIVQGKATSDLLQELRVVLEDEADSFLDAVWAKVKAVL